MLSVMTQFITDMYLSPGVYMRKTYFIFIIICSLNSIVMASMNKDINPLFYNTWLRYEYFEDIKEGKTPRQSLRMQPLMQLYFFEDANKLLYGSFNEGITAEYVVKCRDTLLVNKKFKESEVEFVLYLSNLNDETFLIVDDGNVETCFKRLDKKYYNINGVQYFVNDRFITGNYLLGNDSLSNCTFYYDGRVTGFQTYIEYQIPLVLFELPDEFDTILLRYISDGKKNTDVFHWQKSGNNLEFNYLSLQGNFDDPMQYKDAKITNRNILLRKNNTLRE